MTHSSAAASGVPLTAACLLLPGRTSPLERTDTGYVLDAVLAEIATWPVDPIVVVLGRDAEEAVRVIEFGAATITIDSDWKEGEASSLRVGLDTLQRLFPDVDQVVVASASIADTPVGIATTLIEALASSDRQAAVPRYRYAIGMPVLLRRSIWERLMSLEDDQSLLSLLTAHPGWTRELHVDALPPGVAADTT